MDAMKCKDCKWHDDWTWVCFNAYSNERADITDENFGCKHWEDKRNEGNSIKPDSDSESKS